MNTPKGVSFEEVFRPFESNEQFKEEERKIKPFYDLIVEVITRRVDLGLSQKELAKRARTHQSRISKIESGEHDVRLSTLIQIAEALKCELSIQLIPFEDAQENSYVPLFTDCVRVGDGQEDSIQRIDRILIENDQ